MPLRRLSALVLLACLTQVLLLGWTTLGVRIATADDWAIEQGLVSPKVALANRAHDFRIGRFYAEVKFDLLEAQQRLGEGVGRAFIRVGSLALAAGALAWFVAAMTGEGAVAALVLLLALGLAPVSIGYSALLSYPLLWWGWAAVWIMGALAVGPYAGARGGLIALAYAFALLVHEANLVFVFLPVAAHALSTGAWRAAVRLAAPALLVAFAYVALFVLMRRQALEVWPGDTYGGARISGSLPGFFHATTTFSLSGLPAFETWLLRSENPDSGIFRSGGDWALAVSRASWPAILAGALAGLTGWFLLCRGRGAERRVRAADLLVLLVVVAFSANALLALTDKYQEWSHQRMWPYYYTGMSYLAWCGLLGIGLAGAVSRGRRRWLAFGLAGVISVAVVAVSVTNAEAAGLLRRHRFDHINGFRTWFSGTGGR